jgi:glycosyltransferase involved in cell wall biosynthesis
MTKPWGVFKAFRDGPDRVALITTSYPAFPGDPAGHFVEAEARRTAAGGSQVTVLAPGVGSPSPPGSNPGVVWIRDDGLFGWPGAMSRLASNPVRALGGIRFVIAARRALALAGPFDRVVAHWIVPSAWPIAAGLARDLEVVAHGSDVALLCGLPRPLRLHILRSLVNAGARFRFVSRDLKTRLGATSRPEWFTRSRVEPCPIDVETDATREAARTALGLDHSTSLALVVARLIPGKRVDVALSALSLLRGVQVVVVGEGPMESMLRSRFPGVRWLGRLSRPETLRWIRAADVLVATSRQEGSSTVVREAIALSTAVVMAPSGDLVDDAPGITCIASGPAVRSGFWFQKPGTRG